MIKYCDSGSIIDDPSDILILPCNMIPGVLGKGLALTFKRRWPQLVGDHKRSISDGLLSLRVPSITIIPGSGHQTASGQPRQICFFPTKDDWRDPSRLEWIHDGMRELVRRVQFECPNCRELPIASVAMPAVGCGLGGLPWDQVRPLIELAELQTPDVQWNVYLPKREKRS